MISSGEGTTGGAVGRGVTGNMTIETGDSDSESGHVHLLSGSKKCGTAGKMVGPKSM
jgi:hypothetical protein